MSAIQMDELTFQISSFGLRDVSASIPDAKITTIVGPNGSGKSTLLKLLAKLLQPNKGTIRINNKPVNEYKSTELAQTISMLTQSKGMLPELSVRELVTYGRIPYKRPFEQRMNDKDLEIIDWALEVTDTKHLENRMFHALSGGEQQKARIAMALAQKTGILILDEPTTYLDMSHQLEVMELLQYINEKLNITVLMVLHDLQQAVKFSHHLIAMKQGQIVRQGKPKDIITPLFLKEIYSIEAKINYENDYPLIIPIQAIKSKEDSKMIIVTNTSKIKKGCAHKLIERFDKVGKVETMKGFLGLEVLLTESTEDYEEVTVSTRWESKEDFQAWTRSDAFKESHAHRQIPDYILSNKITFYDVKIVRKPIVAAK